MRPSLARWETFIVGGAGRGETDHRRPALYRPALGEPMTQLTPFCRAVRLCLNGCRWSSQVSVRGACGRIGAARTSKKKNITRPIAAAARDERMKWADAARGFVCR